MKRLFGVVLPLALVIGVVASQSQSATKKPIIIGAVVGFTGFMNPFDVPPYNAARLAVTDINKKGGVLGRPLQIISADGKSDKVQAGTAADSLLDKGAAFITAPCDFDFGAAAAIESQKRKIVGMSMCAGSVTYGPLGIGRYAFTMGNSAATFLSASAEWAYQVKHWRRAYVLQDDSIEFHKEGCRAFVARWKALKGTLVAYDHFQQADASIASQITRIKSSKPAPDFIVECSHPPGAITALRQIRSSGIKTAIIGEGESFDGEFWKKSVPGLSNFYSTSNGAVHGDDPRPLVNKLVKRLKARFGSAPVTSHFITGYAAIQAFALAAQKAGSLDGPKLVKALESFRNVPLLIGPTTFNSKFHIALKRSVTIVRIQNGKTKFVTTWTPKSIPPLSSWAG